MKETSDSVNFRGNMTCENNGSVGESTVLRKMNEEWKRNEDTSWNTWRMASVAHRADRAYRTCVTSRKCSFILFLVVSLWGIAVISEITEITGQNGVCAQTPMPGVGLPDENAANIQPGMFNPEGNFANAMVTEGNPGSTGNAAGNNVGNGSGNVGNLAGNAENTQSPSAFLRSQNGNSLGSDELISGGNRADTALPESHAMEIAPVNQSVGGSTEALLTSGGQGADELPATADVSEMVMAPAEEAPTSLLDGVESRLTRGGEHEGKEVIDVQILGNERYTTEKIMQQILLRPGHKFRATGLDDDILRLNQSRLFTLVEPYIRSVPGGVIVIFKVQERPVMRYLRFQGNGSMMIGRLEKECGLVPGKPFSPYDVEEGRKKVETFYNSKGYTRASVKTIQGDQKGDPGVIYLVNPGPKLRIKKTDFIGNTIASDARLKTVIQSKPGFMRIFRGELQEEALQNDIRALEDYYRRLGFFYARIGRRVIRTSEDGWNEVTFVIHEGPQAHIREIRFVGNSQFDASMLLEDMKVFEGKPYNKDRLDMSIIKVRRRYGREGYVFADINAETKILDDPGQCDVVFSIKEGKTYRVGRVNVLIEGEFPHTQISTVLNRLSVKPGDLVNVYELQQSERRLKSSQLFAVDPAQGKMPKIVYAPPELQESEEIAAQIGSNAGAVSGSGTTEHRNAGGNGGGSASTSAGNASVGGGAGRAALSGGTTRKVYKMTAADVAEDFQLGENEAFLDVNIYTILRPVENEETVEKSTGNPELNGSEPKTFAEEAETGNDSGIEYQPRMLKQVESLKQA
ncbi:MAG: POTRA domain-containing protein, partial [Planctomycetia bacterium]|nr:POTRA domain-containing protein [Planctomycetia bacterium]